MRRRVLPDPRSLSKTMLNAALSRRRLLALAPAAAVTAALPAAAFAQSPTPCSLLTTTILNDGPALLESISAAFTFQNLMMDAYATGATLRLAQSYSDQALGATAFTYDNAVAIHAYLASEDPENLVRATVLGLGLLHAQATNFPVADGRFGQAYFVNVPDSTGAYITPAAAPFYFYGSAVGDQAWAGMALAQLYLRTRNAAFLDGAVEVGNWIVLNTYSTTGAGGFSFGTNINQYNQSVPSPNGKSTEHNIDCFAFFNMLSHLTGDATSSANSQHWSALSSHAAVFVLAMYNSSGNFFYTGTLPDGATINKSPIPEDVQTWSYLAFLRTSNQASIDWALANLQTTDTAKSPQTALTGSETIHGLVFDTASLTTTQFDPTAVWLEGTAHTAAALVARVLHGGQNIAALRSDINAAVALLEQCAKAQAILGAGQTVNRKAIPLGLGLVAATGVMDTGFGYTYGPSLHIGATGWYLLASVAANPFQSGYRYISATL